MYPLLRFFSSRGFEELAGMFDYAPAPWVLLTLRQHLISFRNWNGSQVQPALRLLHA